MIWEGEEEKMIPSLSLKPVESDNERPVTD